MFFKSSPPFKLYISTYELQWKNKKIFSTPIEGALLAFDFKSIGTGYSDFLPYPKFGENSLKEELEQIKQGKFSKRFLISKYNAFLDAKARSQKRNLFFGLKFPSSHFLIEDLLSFNKEEEIIAKGLTTIKLKLKPDRIKEQIDKLKKLHSSLKNIKWRLDLNGTDWGIWKDKLNFIKNHIDFIEDPHPLNLDRKDHPLFAQDWISNPHFQIKIVKPARDSWKILIKEMALSRLKRVVFTHSFNHPLGQVTDAFWTGVFYKNYAGFFETGGLVCSALKEQSLYPLNQKNPALFSPPTGFGFGFGDSLKKENWKRWV